MHHGTSCNTHDVPWLTTISLGDLETPFLLGPHKAVLAAGTRMPILLRMRRDKKLYIFQGVPNEAVSSSNLRFDMKNIWKKQLFFLVAEATTKLLLPGTPKKKCRVVGLLRAKQDEQCLGKSTHLRPESMGRETLAPGYVSQ